MAYPRGTDPLCLLGHEADRPHPAGELARRCDVRLVLVDPAREQGPAPLDQPPHALGGMPAGARVRGLAPGGLLRPRGARQVVPRGLDQRLPQVLVAGLGDRAPAVAFPAGVLGGRQADPRRERAGVPEPRELAGLEHEVIFETAPTTQSTPRPESLFCRSNPVTPDSYTHLAFGSTDRTHSATAPAS